MFDLKDIRENTGRYETGWKRRGMAESPVQDILARDAAHRALQKEMQELQSQRNDLSRQIGAIKAKGGDAAEVMQKVADIKTRLPALEAQEKEQGEALRDLLSRLPNIPAPDVPDGADENGNVELRRFGNPARHNNVKDHVDIGDALGGMDFETAAKMSGSRFVLLRNGVARLERALAQFMLDLHTAEHGYEECSPPLLVKGDALYGTGQLPKFAEDLFRSAHTDHWLVPTAEVALTNIVRDTIIDAAELPLRFTALTPCFRSEAGAAGKDTRGMIRQHQFYKVELVSVTGEDASAAELERMTQAAETVLKRLELPFRTVALCTGDLGFAARKTYDIEVWMPAQNTYREISSCSNCGDFQARRMMARYRAEGEKQTRYVHTLNGSGVAVGRCLVAVLENYQQPDGSVAVPGVLRPYMGGTERLEPAAGRKGRVVNG